jgi:ribose 5-phosphate isomerase B
MKEHVRKQLEREGHKVTNFGTDSTDSVDYPDFAHPLADHVAQGKSQLGVLLCGSANGVCMTANKHTGIRAAIAWAPDIARLAREHNNANVLCIPARFVSKEQAQSFVAEFVNSQFEGGRHERRVQKISSTTGSVDLPPGYES